MATGLNNIGSVRVDMYTESEDIAGGISIYLGSPPTYLLHFCTTTWSQFSVALPVEQEKIWTITRKTDYIIGNTLKVECNDQELLNIRMSMSNVCDKSDWRGSWGGEVHVKKIKFASEDSATRFYRAIRIPGL